MYLRVGMKALQRCACASYSLIICDLCVTRREYLLFVFRFLWDFVYHISPDYFGDDLCFHRALCSCFCSSVFLSTLSCIVFLYVFSSHCFVNAVLYKCNILCCKFEFVLICFIVIWLTEWNPSQSLINTYLAAECWWRQTNLIEVTLAAWLSGWQCGKKKLSQSPEDESVRYSTRQVVSNIVWTEIVRKNFVW